MTPNPAPDTDLARICDDDARRVLRFAAPLVSAILVLEGLSHIGGASLALIVVPWIAALPVGVLGAYALRPAPAWAPPERYWPLAPWIVCHTLLLLHMTESTVWGAAFFMLGQLFASAAFMLARLPMAIAVGTTWATLAYWKAAAMPDESWAFVLFALPLAVGVHLARYRTALLADRERLAQLELAARRDEAERFHRLSALSRAFADHFRGILDAILDADRDAMAQLPEDHGAAGPARTIQREAEAGLELLGRITGPGLPGARTPEHFAATELLDPGSLRAQVAPPHHAELEVVGELPGLRGQPDRLRAAIRELVGNAVAALPDDGGLVRVEMRATEGEPHGKGEGVEIAVIDSGRGMDATTRERALEPFFTTREGHRGLGLSYVLGAVEQHDGDLTLESQVGVGSRARIILPGDRPPRTAQDPADR